MLKLILLPIVKCEPVKGRSNPDLENCHLRAERARHQSADCRSTNAFETCNDNRQVKAVKIISYRNFGGWVYLDSVKLKSVKLKVMGS
jgi:hypothetical protein